MSELVVDTLFPVSKRCRRCRAIQPLELFCKGNAPDGRAYWCRPCRTQYRRDNKDRINARVRSLAVSDPLLWKASHWRKRYGLTREQYGEMLDRQKNCCAICGEEMLRPCVDHCHETGRVRALLCRSCNVGLGYFRDRRDLLEAASHYLAMPETNT